MHSAAVTGRPARGGAACALAPTDTPSEEHTTSAPKRHASWIRLMTSLDAYWVKTVTSADMPAASVTSGGTSTHVTFTGTRCTTLTKLPDALSGGKSENRAPVPGEVLSTLPTNVRPGNASTVISARSPACIFPTWVSLKLAITYVPLGTTVTIC